MTNRLGMAVLAMVVSMCGLLACNDDGDDPMATPDAGEEEARADFDLDAWYEDAAPCEPDDSAAVPDRDDVGEWVKVELPDTFCSDGSQYKFFVNYSDSTNDLVIMFEPGGACWDYESCTNMRPRGAANPNGIPDDHMMVWSIGYPVWAPLEVGDGNGGTSLTFMKNWNKVFLPYCTGDVFAGNMTRTYESEDGSDTIEYRHVGQQNMEKIIPWLDETFTDVPRLVVGGCSAGGVGSLVNYHQLRSGITGSQCGYLVNDSGPLFPSSGPSSKLQEKLRTAWDTQTTIDKLAELGTAIYGEGGDEVLDRDMGALSELLALTYPSDRMTLSVYRWDFNYSLYSYEQFYPDITDDEIYQLWGEDLDAMTAQYDRYPNLAYFLAHARPDNCSHCLSIAPLDHIDEALAGEPYLGTEIEQDDVNLHDFYQHVLDDEAPLKSYLEDMPPSGEGLSAEETAECRM